MSKINKEDYAGLIPRVIKTSVPVEKLCRTRSSKGGKGIHLVAMLTRSGIVCVRNCYGRKVGYPDGRPGSFLSLWIENIGSVSAQRLKKKRTSLRPTILDRSIANCKLSCLSIIEPPFEIDRPAPRFMLDLDMLEFKAAFQVAQWTEKHEIQKRAARIRGTDSIERPPMAVMLEAYREMAGIYDIWTRERVLNLAAMYSCTTDELASLAECPVADMRALAEDDLDMISRAAKMWLFHLEKVAEAAKLGRPPISIFPPKRH